MVTLVARHGHVASLEAVGYQDLESKTPMRTDTIFRIASLTKPVTCAGVMILVDEGRLSLIDPGGEVPAGVQGTAAEPVRNARRLQLRGGLAFAAGQHSST